MLSSDSSASFSRTSVYWSLSCFFGGSSDFAIRASGVRGPNGLNTKPTACAADSGPISLKSSIPGCDCIPWVPITLPLTSSRVGRAKLPSRCLVLADSFNLLCQGYWRGAEPLDSSLRGRFGGISPFARCRALQRGVCRCDFWSQEARVRLGDESRGRSLSSVSRSSPRGQTCPIGP